jgi:hypothetical protein
MGYTVDDFLAAYSPTVRDLALQLRALIRRVMPKTIEQIDLPANMITYGLDRSYGGLVCGITPQHAHVSLVFANGVALPDTEHLLEGTGKQVRHLKIRLPADIEAPALLALLTAAAAPKK